MAQGEHYSCQNMEMILNSTSLIMWELLSCLCLSQIPLINTYHICKKKHWKHLKFVKIDISDHINNYTENQVVKENNEFLFH